MAATATVITNIFFAFFLVIGLISFPILANAVYAAPTACTACPAPGIALSAVGKKVHFSSRKCSALSE